MRKEAIEEHVEYLENRVQSFMEHFREARDERKIILDKVHLLDQKVNSLDQKVDKLDKKVDKCFDEIKRLLIKSVE